MVEYKVLYAIKQLSLRKMLQNMLHNRRLVRTERCRRLRHGSTSLLVHAGRKTTWPRPKFKSDDSVTVIPSSLADTPLEIMLPKLLDEVTPDTAPLSDYWSVVMFQKKDHLLDATNNMSLFEKYSFRLVRNSEPQSALYLHGEEIFASMEAVWEVNSAAQFFIRTTDGSLSNGAITKNERGRLRCILYRCLWQLEFSSVQREVRPLREAPPRRRRCDPLFWLDLCDAAPKRGTSRTKRSLVAL